MSFILSHGKISLFFFFFNVYKKKKTKKKTLRVTDLMAFWVGTAILTEQKPGSSLCLIRALGLVYI